MQDLYKFRVPAASSRSVRCEGQKEAQHGDRGGGGGDTLNFFLSASISGRATVSPSMLYMPFTIMMILRQDRLKRGCPTTTLLLSRASKCFMSL